MTSRGPGRPAQTTRADVREAARALFLAQGYAGTSLSQVAAAVGVSRTTLFAYVPAKRDLIWEEPELDRLRTALAEHPGPLVDAIAAGLVAGAHYRVAEHQAMSERWQVVMADEELRAFAGLRAEEICQALIDGARLRTPSADPERLDHVARALLAVARRCIQQWALLSGPDEDLGTYTAVRLRSFVEALRPLLP